MNETPAPVRLSSEIKKFFKEEFDLIVSCTKGLSKNPFYRVWTGHRGDDTPKFPLTVRIGMLRAIYGEKDFIQNGSAGNIEPHSMAFKKSEWQTFKTMNISFQNE